MWTVVIETGAANTASVMAGLARAGARPSLVDRPEPVRSADRVVLPGVGAFGPAMRRLEETGLAEALVDRIRGDRPTLTICLGFQLLFRSSAESPGVSGLGVIERDVTAFSGDVVIPQMGWNRVLPGSGNCRDMTRQYYEVTRPPNPALSSASGL